MSYKVLRQDNDSAALTEKVNFNETNMATCRTKAALAHFIIPLRIKPWELAISNNSSCEKTIKKNGYEEKSVERGRKRHDSRFPCFHHSRSKDFLFKIVKSCNLLFTLSFTTFHPQYQLGLLIFHVQVNSTAVL